MFALFLFDVQAQNIDYSEKEYPIKSVPDFFKKKDSLSVVKPKK